jgi:hypothetical protein
VTRLRSSVIATAVAAATAIGLAYTWTGAPAARPTSRPAPRPVLRPVVRLAPAAQTMAMPAGVTMPDEGPPLGPRVEHGLAHRLPQYPAVFLASPRQRAASEQLRNRLFSAAVRLAAPSAAEAAGFDLRRPRRRHGETRVMWFHAENRRWHAARDGRLDPDHPDTLIYADLPGRPLKLVGVMISMPRGVRGPVPGGPITRWHYHLVCVSGRKRGLAPRGDGSCPTGSTLRVGSEMLHVWFTRDLRSAYAIHAPWPELCASQLLPPVTCASGHAIVGM